MYARVTTIEGAPGQAEEGIRTFREQVLPVLDDVEGCKGTFLLVDRNTGKALGVTLWASEDAMMASEEMADRLRSQAAESVPAAGAARVERYEVPIFAVEAGGL